MPKFITPVSMKVTKKQFQRDLKGPLLELGYIEYSIALTEINNLLCTNYINTENYLGSSNKSHDNRYGRYHIDHYNPELFLALAAMTSEQYGVCGEYFIGLQNYTGHTTKGKLYKALRPVNEKGSFIIDSGDKGSHYKRPFGTYRKATKDELINHFTNNKNTMSKPSRFPFQLHANDAKRIIDIACNEWKPKLTKRWHSILTEDTVEVTEDFYRTMREACTTDQSKVFDEIFGSDFPEVTYKAGDRFSRYGIEYILCRYDSSKYACLFSLSDGNAWCSGIEVKDHRSITKQEFDAICGNIDPTEFTKIN